MHDTRQLTGCSESREVADEAGCDTKRLERGVPQTNVASTAAQDEALWRESEEGNGSVHEADAT